MKGTLVDWWRRRRLTRPRVDSVAYYEGLSEVPEEVPRHTLAIVGTPEFPKWAVFECPCGRGHRLTVNLSRARQPTWRLTVGNEGPSLYPSLDYDGKYHCHFWLRRGRVEWAPEWGNRL